MHQIYKIILIMKLNTFVKDLTTALDPPSE